MRKIVFLGDSIRLYGYGTVIKNYLREDDEIFMPEDNCRFSKYLLRCIFEYRDQIEGSDIVHFNAGLWDTCALFNDEIPFSSIEEYKENIRRCAELLLRYSKRVIFSTTTPTRIGQEHNTIERIKDFNDAVVPMLENMGVEVIDLYSLIVKDINKYIGEDMVHLTEEGVNLTAKTISEVINNQK